MTDADLHALTGALHDRYRIDGILGVGGMATVYRAHDLQHRRQVAVKVLSSEFTELLGRERFQREIETTANLRHPHILPLYDSGEAGGRLFYVMPLVEGETLRARMDREQQLPLDDALTIAREVADALSYAHGRGVIHRDIKPENILLEGGHAIVADFGIALAAPGIERQALTRTGMAIGTPPYMSPEQALGEKSLDQRSDLYALACVLYEMLAGQPPFTGPTAEVIARQHLLVEAPRVTNLRPTVHPAVADAIARSLAKSPADRFGSVSQFSSAIAPAVITAEVPAKSAPRAPRRALLASGVAALVTVAVAAYAWVQRDTKPADDASIAVLPFVEQGADASNAHLGDGIAETLISALSNLSGLRVIARTSAFSLRDKALDVREIGRRLGVATVLEGSVQRSGEQLRVTAQLVKAADGVSLWSQVFDRPAADIFAVQDEVARAVSAALVIRRQASSASGDVSGTTNAAAYEAYLLGRHQWSLRTTAGMLRAEKAFRSAIEADSGYARAWSGLADTYSLLTPAEYGLPGFSYDSIVTLAERAARRAIQLAPTLGDAHVSLAQVEEMRGRWDTALQAYEKGVALSPGYATGRQWYSYHLATRNRTDDAIREMEIARRLDPLSHVIVLSLASAYDADGRFADATPLYQQGFELAPDAWWSMILFCSHQLQTIGRDAAGPCYRRLRLATGSDSAKARDTERGLQDPARRDSAIDAIPRDENLLEVIPLLRAWRGDDAVLARLRAAAAQPIRNDFNKSMLVEMLSPASRKDPRVRALMVQLGYPRWTP